jgi:hypothetical protein
VIGATSLEAPVVRPGFGLIDQLLRDRDAMLARIAAGRDLAAITRTMVATIAIAMAIVGAAIGSYRGGVQIAYAAVKLPLVLLGTAALSAPALTAIGASLGRRARLTADLALVIAALAFGAMLLAACTPLILLGHAMELGYHDMVLGLVMIFGIAGFASLRMIVHALSLEQDQPGRGSAIIGLCIVFALVGGQLSWALRPYLVRPRTEDVPFIRPVADSLFDAITGTIRSARGVYTRDSAPLPEGD